MLCCSCYCFYARKGILSGKGEPQRKQFRVWTEEEKRGLRKWRKEGVLFKEIALRLGRSLKVVKAAAYRLRIVVDPEEKGVKSVIKEQSRNLPDWWDKSERSHEWDERSDNVLRQMALLGKRERDMADRLGVRIQSVSSRLRVLGITPTRARKRVMVSVARGTRAARKSKGTPENSA